MTTKLTNAQTAFLEDYFLDILGDNVGLLDLNREDFVARVTNMDFDDGAAASPAQIQVASNLHRLGLFSEFDPHDSIDDSKHIYVVFSAKGADAIYDLMQARKDELVASAAPKP